MLCGSKTPPIAKKIGKFGAVCLEILNKIMNIPHALTKKAPSNEGAFC